MPRATVATTAHSNKGGELFKGLPLFLLIMPIVIQKNV